MSSRRTFLRASAAALVAAGAAAVARAQSSEIQVFLPVTTHFPTPTPTPSPTVEPTPTPVVPTPGPPPWPEPPTYESRIVARASGTVEQALAWLQPRADASYTDFDIATIVRAYRDIGERAGVDWFVAIAQMAHETGSMTSWWSQRPRRNPAGIAVTGRTSTNGPGSPPGLHWAWDERSSIWREGVSFAEWVRDAIPAHLGRLLAYALHDDQASEAQRALIGVALGYRTLPASFRGSSPRWVDLNGRWAVPGTTYGQAIINLARRIRGDSLLAADAEPTLPGDEDGDWAPLDA